MPDTREVEVAAGWFAREHYDAVRIRRAYRGQYHSIDMFGADILAYLPPSEPYGLLLIDATKANRNTEGPTKRKELERLAGDTPVPPQPWETRMLAWWHYEQDGLGTVHYFDIEQWVPKTDVENLGLEATGVNRHLTLDGTTYVWANWPTPVRIDKDTWYNPPG